jgi:hypothetical protein
MSVALVEDFDVESRGIHQDTGAIQRTATGLDDLGTVSFLPVEFYARSSPQRGIFSESVS